MSMRVLGVDYSIQSPGFCLHDSYSTTWWVKYFPKGKPFGDLSADVHLIPYPDVEGTERYIGLAAFGRSILDMGNVDMVVMEDYAFGANGRITQLAENGGTFKAMLHTYFKTIPLRVVAPSTLKKFATGNGRAQKEDVWTAFVAERPDAALWPKQLFPKSRTNKILSPLSDIADSYYLAKYGQHLAAKPHAN